MSSMQFKRNAITAFLFFEGTPKHLSFFLSYPRMRVSIHFLKGTPKHLSFFCHSERSEESIYSLIYILHQKLKEFTIEIDKHTRSQSCLTALTIVQKNPGAIKFVKARLTLLIGTIKKGFIQPL